MRTEYDDVIRAWLDGAEVEQYCGLVGKRGWHTFDGCWELNPEFEWQYRIAKPAKWTQHAPYHFSRDIAGERVDWWPSKCKAMYRGAMVRGRGSVSKLFKKLRLEE
jgi:hypothetical protein